MPEGYAGVVMCAVHRERNKLVSRGIKQWLKPEHVVYDLKSALPPEIPDARL